MTKFGPLNRKPKPRRWRKWDGRYRKEFYDVQLQDWCKTVVKCWPNAGKMVALDGSGRSWTPDDDIRIRLTDESEEFEL